MFETINLNSLPKTLKYFPHLTQISVLPFTKLNIPFLFQFTIHSAISNNISFKQNKNTSTKFSHIRFVFNKLFKFNVPKLPSYGNPKNQVPCRQLHLCRYNLTVFGKNSTSHNRY